MRLSKIVMGIYNTVECSLMGLLVLSLKYIIYYVHILYTLISIADDDGMNI